MKGDCEKCGVETDVHGYVYKGDPRNVIYLCDPCFKSQGSTETPTEEIK